jgi:RNA polymerase sigma factor (sigma-70 family)
VSLLGSLREEGVQSESRFEAFYRAEFANAARLAYLLCGSQLISDDLVQEAFLAVEPKFEQVHHPAAYLRTTLVRMSATAHRRTERRAGLLPKLYEDKVLDASTTELFDVLGLLPYQQRAALTLRYWCGLDTQEIADALGCRSGTVKSSISRGLQRLRNELKDAG